MLNIIWIKITLLKNYPSIPLSRIFLYENPQMVIPKLIGSCQPYYYYYYTTGFSFEAVLYRSTRPSQWLPIIPRCGPTIQLHLHAQS